MNVARRTGFPSVSRAATRSALGPVDSIATRQRVRYLAGGSVATSAFSTPRRADLLASRS